MEAQNDDINKNTKCWTRRTSLEKVLTVTNILLLILILGALFYVAISPTDNRCKTPICMKISAELTRKINKSSDPCESFQNITCSTNKFDPKPRNRLLEVEKIILDHNYKETNSLSLVKQLYNSCMSPPSSDQDEERILLSLINEIGGWPVIKGRPKGAKTNLSFDFMELTLRARKMGLKNDWFVKIESRMDRAQIIPEFTHPPISKLFSRRSKLEYHYLELMKFTARKLGAHWPSIVKKEMAEVVNLEDKLHAIILNCTIGTNSSDLSIMSIEEIQMRWPEFEWLPIIDEITNSDGLILQEFPVAVNLNEQYLDDLLKLLDKTPKRVHANYFVWKIVYEFCPFLSHEMREMYEFHHLIELQKPFVRSDFCTKLISDEFRSVIYGEVARRNIDKATRTRIKNMATLIKDAALDLISDRKTCTDGEFSKFLQGKVRTFDLIVGGTDLLFDHLRFEQILGVSKFTFDATNIVSMLNEIQIHNSDLSHCYKDKEKDELMILDMKWTHENVENTITLPVETIQDTFKSEGPDFRNFAQLGTIISRQVVWNLLEFVRNGTDEYNAENVTRCLGNNLQFDQNDFKSASTLLALDIAYRSYVKFSENRVQLPGWGYTSNQLFWILTNSSLSTIVEKLGAFQRDFYCT